MRSLLEKVNFGTRMVAMLGVNLVLFMATSALGIYYLSAIKAEMREISEFDFPITQAISAVTAHQLEQTILFERAMRLATLRTEDAGGRLATTRAQFDDLNDTIEAEIRSVQELAHLAVAEAHTEEAKAEFQRVLETMERAEREHDAFADNVQEAFALIDQGRTFEIERLVSSIEDTADELDRELTGLLVKIERFTQQALVTVEEHEHAGLVTLASLATVGLLLGLVTSFLVLRSSAAVARQATDATRIKVALDNANTNVMVADTDLNIVYLNQAMGSLMRGAEADLRKDLPNLNVNQMIGSSVDLFHKNPAQQRGIIEQLTAPFETTIEVGGHIFDLVASPVTDDRGERVGTVVEWADMTAERNVEAEVDRVVAAAADGDFSQRIALDDKEGFMRKLAEAINRLSETTASAIEDVAGALGALAEGDLTRRIEADYSGLFDKLKTDANATADRLGKIVAEIVAGANEVANAAQEISSGTMDLSQRTEEQASSLEQTAASMEEMASTVKQNAENAQQANQLSISAREVAGKGGEVVGEAVEAMTRIEDSSQKISDIIGVIDEIAFQTNLLALNAAVEAARAGEAGKGFAVVASEVGTLAQRSSEAAKDIKSLIVDSGAQVKEGVQLVNRAGASLDEILSSIKRLSDIVSEIAAASNQQASGIEEINGAVSQMDEMTQQNSALVEESAAAARTLTEEIAARAITEAHTEEAEAEFRHVAETLRQAEGKHTAFADHVDEAFALIDQGRSFELERLVSSIEEEADQLDRELTALHSEIARFTEQALDTAEAHEQAGLMTLSSLAAAGLLLGLIISFLVLRSSAAVARQATESTRIKVALDNANTNVMVADTDLNIVYINRTMDAMMRSAEADLRKDLPSLNVSDLIGTGIDLFYMKTAHQRGMIEQLSSPLETTVELGGHIFDLVASPVKNERGERVGTVVEWADMTAERNVEAEVDRVVAAAADGDFSQRIALDDKEGFMRKLAEAINRLSETTASAIEDVAGALGALAEGDLTRRIEADYSGLFDKLKTDANATADRLGKIVAEIVAGANEVANAAQEISSGTMDLSQRTEEQASSLEQTAASMEEMASTVKQNAENAQQANQLSISAREVAGKGGEVVGEAVEAMTRIEDSSQKISDIIGVIDEIAFQTNLLALNAAVEAARAGEAGKGFAVVASEVGTLAQRSSEAAKDIKSLIVDSGAQVKEGVQLVNRAGASLDEILSSIKRLSDIVSEIAAASNQQASGIEEINGAVSQMDEMTQQNSALVEESAAAARTLTEQSQAMRERMLFFRTEDSEVVAQAGLSAKASFEAKTGARPQSDRPRPGRSKAAPMKLAVGDGRSAPSADKDDDWKEF